MITEEQFILAFQEYDIGNAQSALFILKDKIEKGIKSFNGTPITILFIKEKYDAYNKWWLGKFGKSDPKYLNAKDKKKSVYDFLVDGSYNNTYTREEQPRDYYLFGKMDKDKMIEITKQFVKDAKTRKI